MPDEFKPCPFCGGRNLVVIDYGGYYVSCISCDAEGPMRKTTEAAVTRWNTRQSPETTPPATGAEVKL